jgi:hypothetical protein
MVDFDIYEKKYVDDFRRVVEAVESLALQYNELKEAAVVEISMNIVTSLMFLVPKISNDVNAIKKWSVEKKNSFVVDGIMKFLDTCFETLNEKMEVLANTEIDDALWKVVVSLVRTCVSSTVGTIIDSSDQKTGKSGRWWCC